VALREVEGPAGAPWERALRGRLDELTVESELLAGNPLGDPARRPLYVFVPESVASSDDRFLAIYLIQGFTGQVDMWLDRSAYEPNMIERLDELFTGGGCPPALVVLVDAWTSYGGSQFINSVATGPYMDYLCDEVVPFIDERYQTIPDRDHRGITGKSSGGYGAMVVPMLRPDVFGALASHAGDALFENCYTHDFPKTARVLRDHFEGSYDVFFERLRSASRFEQKFHDALDAYAMAACYSPDEERPGKAVLPFEIDTARLIPEVWERWLAWDPVRIAPHRMEALASMHRIYLDAGKSDEYNLDLGAQAFSNELNKGGIPHALELFEGGHGGLQYRYPGAIKELVIALSE
jgi:hypothetical protein